MRKRPDKRHSKHAKEAQTMSEEQQMILRMVAEEKISADEGARLLEAMGLKEDSRTRRDSTDDLGGRLGSLLSSGAVDWLANLRSVLGPRMTHAEELDQTLDAEGVEAVQVETANGKIDVTGTDTPQISIQTRKAVRAPTEEDARAFAEHVEILIDEADSRIRIGKKHPLPPPGVTVAVDFSVQCPRTIDLDLRSSNGKVRACGIEGSLKLRTSNGKVRLESVTGPATAETRNGSIHASCAELKGTLALTTRNGEIRAEVESGSAPIRLETGNGSVSLTLPEGYSGMLDARTARGGIRSELPVAAPHRDKRRLTGQLGAGDETPIDVETKNGSIRLRQLPVS